MRLMKMAAGGLPERRNTDGGVGLCAGTKPWGTFFLQSGQTFAGVGAGEVHHLQSQ